MSHLQYLLDGGKSSDAKYAQLKAQHSGATTGTGTGGSTTTTTTKPPAIASFVGSTVFDSEGNPYVIKTRVDRNMGTVYWMSAPDGRAFHPDATVWQSGTGRIFQFSSAGDIISERNLTADERAGDGGGSAGRTQFPSEVAVDTAQAAYLQAQAKNIQTAEERAADRVSQERINRLRDLNDLIQQAMGNQQSAREMKFGLREDPFALAGAFSAQGPRGVTPTQAFSNELGNYANAPLPTVPQNATLPQINAAIGQVPGAVPMGGGFGMAEGGSMGPEGPDFSPPGYSVIVGEGALNGDEEVVTRLNDGTVLVTPLKGGAATGATLPTASSSYAALADLYRPFGFQNIPRAADVSTRGGGYATSGLSPAQFSEMGYSPNLIRQTGRPEVYYIDPSTNELRHVTAAGFKGAGFNFRDVLNVPQISGTRGPQLTGLPDIGPDRGAYGPSTVPLLTPFGQILPNPFYIGAELQDAALNDPIAWSNYVSVYQNARGPGGEALGISPDQLLAMAKAPFPTGVPRQVLGYR